MSGLIEACPFTILLMLTTANEIKKYTSKTERRTI